MAKINPLGLKILFIGVPFLIGVALLPTNSPESMKSRSNKSVSSSNSASKGDANASKEFQPTKLGLGMLPASLTNNSGPWIFTGSLERNGTHQARFQNHSTGESVFLSPGEHWLGLTIISVNGDTIVVSGLNTPISRPTNKMDRSSQLSQGNHLNGGLQGAVGATRSQE